MSGTLASVLLVACLQGGAVKYDPLDVVLPFEVQRGFERTLDLGDLDADGFSEVAVAGWGVVYGLRGVDRGAASRFVADPSQSFRYCFGQALAVGRLLTGVPLVAIGDPCGPGVSSATSGHVLIVDPLQNQVLADVPSPAPTDAEFGDSLASGRDFTGDGIDDLVIVAGNTGWLAGTVFLYDGFTLQQTWRFDGDSGERLKGPVDIVDDVDGDGVADVLVGSVYYQPWRGRAMILSGATGYELWRRTGNPDMGLGLAVRTLGDLTGDGIREFAISTWGLNRKDFLFIHDGASLQEVRRIDLAGVMYGPRDVEATADLNEDGVNDLMVLGVSVIPGYISVLAWFSGRDGSLLDLREDPPVHNGWINDVDEAGDLNGDGLPDLLIAHVLQQQPYGILECLQARSLRRDQRVHFRSGALSSPWLLSVDCPSLPGGTFALLYSTGSTTGVPFGTRTLPLDWSPLLVFSATNPWFGTLDGAGQARVPVILPQGSPGLYDTRVHACFVGLDPTAPYGVRAISNALSIPVE